MKIQTLILAFGLTSFLAIADETNWVTAAPWFREVDGKLYNTQQSILFKPFQGQCVSILTNGIVLQQMHQEAIMRTDRYGNGNFLTSTESYVKIGERTVYGEKIFIENFPIDLNTTVGSQKNGMAMPVGRCQINGENLVVWDYGAPHRVMVVTTNEIKTLGKKEP